MRKVGIGLGLWNSLLVQPAIHSYSFMHARRGARMRLIRGNRFPLFLAARRSLRSDQVVELGAAGVLLSRRGSAASGGKTRSRMLSTAWMT